MKWKTFGYLSLTIFSTVALLQSTVHAQGTAFTYQGQLFNLGLPANGNYDLTFSLYNTNAGSEAISGPVTNSATVVNNGLFTVTLDFGSQFTGGDRWLQVGVRTNRGGAFTTLAPRTPVTAVPYAMSASSLIGNPVSVLLYGGALAFQTHDTNAEFWSIQSDAFGPGIFGIVRYSLDNPSNSPSADEGKSFFITPGGAVGIGTSTPASTLDCTGFAAFRRGILVQNQFGSTAMEIDGTTGNVGIGTLGPQQKLDVSGTIGVNGIQIIDASGNITANNVLIRSGGAINCYSDYGACNDGSPDGRNSQFGGLIVNDLWVHNIHSWDGASVCVPAGSEAASTQTLASPTSSIAAKDVDTSGIMSDLQAQVNRLNQEMSQKDSTISNLEVRLGTLESLVRTASR